MYQAELTQNTTVKSTIIDIYRLWAKTWLQPNATADRHLPTIH